MSIPSIPVGPDERGAAASPLRDRLSWAVGLVAAVLLLTGLGTTDLWAPDEPRYAQIAEEVRAAEGGPSDWVLLHLNGAPYTQKPPLYYWLAAAIGAPFGRVGEVAARLPSALAGLALVLLAFRFGVRLLGSAAAAGWGAFLLLGIYRFGHLARRAQLDVLLALCEAAALLAFWRLDRGDVSRRTGAALLHAALGLGVLTKGPVALLPLAIIAGFLAWERRLPDLRRACPWWGWLLSVAPALVWISGAVALAPGGFFGEAVVENVFGRFFEGTSHARPFYYFLLQLPVDLLPTTLLWPLVALEARRVLGDAEDPERRSAWRFLIVWVAVPFVFFSLSAGKRGLYLLPVFTAAALLCGDALHAALSRRQRAPSAVEAALGLAAIALAAAGAALLGFDGFALPSAPGFALPEAFGVACLAVAAAAFVAVRWGSRRWGAARAWAGASLGAVIALELAVFTLVYPAFDAEKSPRPIALAATAAVGDPAGPPIGVFDQRALVGGIVYYADHPIVELPDEAAVEAFLADGGTIVITRASRFERLRAVAPFQIRDRIRSGSREVWIASAAPRAGATPIAAE